MSIAMIREWVRAQDPKGPALKKAGASVFYNNLEDELDVRRADQSLMNLRTQLEGVVDFSSNDALSLSRTGQLRAAFFEELARNPNFLLGSTGPRLLDGNNKYIETVEAELAAFHGAETALIVNSGYEGNGAIFSVLPRAGDAIVYDELMHASVYDGMKDSLARCQMPFRHNDVDSLYETLEAVRESQPQISSGSRSVIIVVEAVYSMDGDICPLLELIQAAREVFPLGNAQFMVDEAHSTGILGPRGAGVVSALGVEKEIAIRMHTFGKAMSSTGAVILANDTVRTMLINHARSIIYTTAPSFPMLASIRAAYTLMKTDATQKAQMHIQHLAKLFFKTITSKPIWARATESKILCIPLAEDWESRPEHTHICPVWTHKRYNYYLFFHLQLAKYCAFPIDFPVVPKGKSRIRIIFHATNTEEEVMGLAAAICEWAEEMLAIEDSGKSARLPSAARKVYEAD